MTSKRIYLREWRDHRGYSQRQVVDRLEGMEDEKLPTTTASLSRLENGKQTYTQRVLEALADIYQCEVFDLLANNPLIESEVIDLTHYGLNETQRASVRALVESMGGRK